MLYILISDFFCVLFSVKIVFIFQFWTHTWQHLRLTAGTALRVPSWKCSKDYIGWQGLNQSSLLTKQVLYTLYYLSGQWGWFLGRSLFVFLIFNSRILVLENFGNYILLVKSVFVVDWRGNSYTLCTQELYVWKLLSGIKSRPHPIEIYISPDPEVFLYALPYSL